jgi:hypothetical protein
LIYFTSFTSVLVIFWRLVTGSSMTTPYVPYLDATEITGFFCSFNTCTFIEVFLAEVAGGVSFLLMMGVDWEGRFSLTIYFFFGVGLGVTALR